MTSASNREDHAEHVPLGPGRWRSLPIKRTVAMASLGLAIFTAGWSGANGPAIAALVPGGSHAPPVSTQQLAAEVRWAGCLRAQGVLSFPDPNSQGAFDSSKFDDRSPAFQTARNACKSVEPTGAIPVVAGRP
jgi:hypothetical protein